MGFFVTIIKEEATGVASGVGGGNRNELNNGGAKARSIGGQFFGSKTILKGGDKQ